MSTQMTGAQMVVQALKDQGVDTVFGYPGGAVLPIYDEIFQQNDIRHILVRHEQGATHAADGYARVTGKASVVLSHLGPGLSNAATGVANAALDCIPMVVIAGDIPSHYYGKHPHQEVNLHADGAQSEIYRPFVKRVWRVERPELFPEIMEKAFQLAESGQPGPVLVDVPMDIFSRKVDVALFDRQQHNAATCCEPHKFRIHEEPIIPIKSKPDRTYSYKY